MNTAQRIDRPWSQYPIGTKAFASGGGHWTKTVRGWQWFSGASFGTPGGDAYCVQLPTVEKG